MLRSVCALDLPETAKTKLIELGYEYCEDIEKALVDANDMPPSLRHVVETYNVAEELRRSRRGNIKSAVELWNSECCEPAVAVFHKGLDTLLRGGLPIGQITELCGAPGSGKTQMCLQVAIDVRIPSEVGGSSGESLYISTDFGFKVERLREMARESVRHVCSAVASSDAPGRVENFTVDTVLRGVNVARINGHKTLIEVVSNMESCLRANGNIKLVVIDSFSLPLVCEVTNVLERTRLVHVMLDKLQELSVKYKFAVLLTNQLTTVITSTSDKKLIPSLGESFGHRVHKRLFLDDGKVSIVKSVDQPKSFVEFRITRAGIR